MYNLLAAIPEQLQHIWYVYDLALLAIIGVCVLILVFLRKRSNIKESEKSLKTANNILRKSKAVSARRRKILLYSAKNVFSSAEYHYNLCISEEDKYEYSKIVAKIKDAIEALDTMLKSEAYKDTEEYPKQIDKVLAELK